MLNISDVVGLLGKGKGAKFGNIVYRVKRNNELARYQMILEADTHKLYEKDIAQLEELIPTLTNAVDIEAARAILNSRRTSLEVGIGNNPDYTCADTYIHADGIPGVKLHKETGVLYVSGLVEHKTVLEEGEPEKPVNSRPLTIAKRKIEKSLPSGRFRTLIIKRVSRLACNGEVIEMEEDETEVVTA